MPEFWIQTALNLSTIIISVYLATKLGDVAAAKYSEKLRLRRELEFERAILLQLKQAGLHSVYLGASVLAAPSTNPLDIPILTLPTGPFSAVFQPEYHPLAKHEALLTAITVYLWHAARYNFYSGLRQNVLETALADGGQTANKSLQILMERIKDLSCSPTDAPGPPSNFWQALAALQKEIERALNDLDKRM